MCTYFDKVVDGIDVFSVGKQQLWDWCSWSGRGFKFGYDPTCTLDNYCDSLRKGLYVVIESHAKFGRIARKSCIMDSFTSLRSAVHFVKYYADSSLEMLNRFGDNQYLYAHDYEIWHIVDDGDLWQLWEHDAELSRVDAPVLLDERDIDGVELDHEQLWSLNVPGVGLVSFLWYLRRGELVEEYLIADWQSEQPRRLKGVGWYDWMSVEDMLACIQSYEMLRDAGSLDVGGRVGADF